MNRLQRATTFTSLTASLLVMGLLLGACAPSGASTPAQSGSAPAASAPAGGAAAPAKPATLTTVKQAIPVNGFGYLPLYVGIERGFFREEGLEMETPLMGSSAAAAALVNGDVDFATAGTGVRAAMQGAPLKAIIYYYNTTLFELVVSPDIRSVEELRGKVMGTSSPGSTEEITASVLVRQAGLDPSRDVTFLLVPAGSQLPTILAGATQGHMLNPDLAVMAQDQGLRILKTVEEVGRVMPAPFSGFSANNDTLQKRPELVKAWMRANLKALQFVRSNPKESAAIIAPILGMELRVAELAVPKAAQAIDPNDIGGFTAEGFNLELDLNLAALKDQAQVTKIEDLVDLTILRQAQRELGLPCRGGYQCR
jgi:NitT/TauT family transport system substrate-binding protein